VAAGPTAFLALSSAVRLLAEVTAGGALHTVTVRDQGVPISAISGVGLSGTVGLVAQF
jgi:hypothetical protein